MSLEQVSKCPVCSNGVFKPFLICKDYTTSEELFHVEQCTACEMVLTNPRPAENNAAHYYQSKSYISHTSAANGIMDYIYLIVRRFTLNWKYVLVKRQLNSNRLLDVGCGTGNFLNYCKEKGVDAFGVEPSAEARAAASNNQVVASLTDVGERKFDVITMWHVLEHVYAPEETVKILKSMLAENGTIFIAVPNWESFDAEHYKQLWAAYDVPRHVWHFSKSTMTRLLESNGLTVKRIIPMKLDSFYVSLLSEKNSAGGTLSFTRMLKGLFTGLKSNIRAKRKMNYSSLIYQVQK